VSVRGRIDHPLTALRPTVSTGHVGLGPRLIHEDQVRQIQLGPLGLPHLALGRYVRSVLLAGVERFFLKRRSSRTRV
jgi:hypothetical protein